MVRVALTGGIATGKSYVLERLRARGVPCLDADELAHGATAAGTEASDLIAKRFGADILSPDGSVDRAKLGSIVFADDEARRALEAIVHPVVYRAIEAGLRAFAAIGDAPIAVVAIPLLDETGRHGSFDKVVATLCSREKQVARLVERGLSAADANRRIDAQLPAAEKAARADFVINTDGSIEETDAQIAAILSAL